MKRAERGITLLEMLLVLSLVSIMAALTFPTIGSGLDSIRLRSGAESLAAFVGAALNRAERTQEPVEIRIPPRATTLSARSLRPGYERTLNLPERVRLRNPDEISLLLYPGAPCPAVTFELVNERGGRRSVRLDPVTGTPEIR